MNLSLISENSAVRFKDKVAIVYGERSITFTKLEEDANRMACALKKMGIKKGDRVAMLQSNNPEFAVTFLGVMKVGGIVVPLDSRYVAAELQVLFNDCTPKALVVEGSVLESLLPHLCRFESIKRIVTVNAAPDRRFTDYEGIMGEYPASKVKADISPEDIAIISYTGGPTMKPHGVALSHKSVYTELVNSAIGFEQTEEDTMVLFALPMYHQFGLTAGLLASLNTGSRIIIVPGTGRSVDSFMDAVEKEKGTIYPGVPYIYSLMLNVARRTGIKHDLSSLRLLISGGAPLEPVIIERFKDVYGMDIHDIYGQTESVCHVTAMPVRGGIKPGSSGKTIPGWEMNIFDEKDNEVPPGIEGEIVLRGPVMSGFWNHPEATDRILRNGWLHTGDAGYMDEENYLYITSRKRRMLILKGQNIFPADIEEVLLTHPEVAGAKVMGHIDLIRGETVKALVRLKKGAKVTEQELRQFCQGRMADYKLPREIVFVDELPEDVPLWRRPQNLAASDLILEGKD